MQIRWLSLCALVLLAGGEAALAADTALAAQLAGRLHEETNLARRARQLAPLAWDENLAGIAAAHSADMARRHYFAHASPDGGTMRLRYEAAHYECRVQVGSHLHLGAENIAQRTQRAVGGHARPAWPDTAQLARDIVRGWMDSAGHRRNLLAPQWRRAGIGVHATETEILVTQNFC